MKAVSTALQVDAQSWLGSIPANAPMDEAYKRFIDMVGEGFTQVTATALAAVVDVLDQAGSTDPRFVEIADLIRRGPGLSFTFPTPGLLTPSTVKTGNIGAPTANALGASGGSVTVGGTWGF
jgi:hypothetical protein